MIGRVLAALGVAALSGCNSTPSAVQSAEAAEERYALVSREGSLGEACATAREVRDAWLAALDDKKYKEWSAMANIYCISSELEGASAPADISRRQDLVGDDGAIGGGDAGEDALNSADDAVAAAANAVANVQAALDDHQDLPGNLEQTQANRATEGTYDE